MTRSKRISTILTQQLDPTTLIIVDESHHHHVPEHLETHFKITAVSQKFNSLNRIERHRLVYRLLADEFNSGLHALSLHLYGTEEWSTHSFPPLQSPACLDGLNNE